MSSSSTSPGNKISFQIQNLQQINVRAVSCYLFEVQVYHHIQLVSNELNLYQNLPNLSHVIQIKFFVKSICK